MNDDYFACLLWGAWRLDAVARDFPEEELVGILANSAWLKWNDRAYCLDSGL